jgi:SAM-dependent methyltransferase
MGFSSEWEKRYAESTHLSVWPWSDIVSLVHRHCKPIIAGGGRVYELGCGAGANIPLFLSLGLDYYAIEGSATIVDQLHKRYPELSSNILVGDFTLDAPFVGSFDLVIDRAALTHNSSKSIQRAIESVFHSLKPGGLFIGSDWFSINHAAFPGGDSADDEYTRDNYLNGQFAGVGAVHFSDEQHLRDLFHEFTVLFLEEKLTKRHEPADQHQFASWNIVARRPLEDIE